MKNYNVVFTASYEIDAEDEQDAEEEARNMFMDELGTESEMQINLFGCHTEEKK